MVGGAVLYGGVLVLLAAAVLLLAQVMAPWIAALIVGIAAAIIGAASAAKAKKNLTPVHYGERTGKNLKTDLNTMREVAQRMDHKRNGNQCKTSAPISRVKTS